MIDEQEEISQHIAPQAGRCKIQSDRRDQPGDQRCISAATRSTSRQTRKRFL